jgi:hypothetical protein
MRLFRIMRKQERMSHKTDKASRARAGGKETERQEQTRDGKDVTADAGPHDAHRKGEGAQGGAEPNARPSDGWGTLRKRQLRVAGSSAHSGRDKARSERASEQDEAATATPTRSC